MRFQCFVSWGDAYAVCRSTDCLGGRRPDCWRPRLPHHYLGPRRLRLCPQSRSGTRRSADRRALVPSVWMVSETRQDRGVATRHHRRCCRLPDRADGAVAVAALWVVTISGRRIVMFNGRPVVGLQSNLEAELFIKTSTSMSNMETTHVS